MTRLHALPTLLALLVLAGCDKAELVAIDAGREVPSGPGAQVPRPPAPDTEGPDALPHVWILRDIRLRQAATGEWARLGWNLDDRCSYRPGESDAGAPDASVADGGVYAGWDLECTPQTEGDLPAEDGEDCRDNNFGRFVSLGFETFPIDPEADVNENLERGEFALMIRMFDYNGTVDDPRVTVEIVQSAYGVPADGVEGDDLRWDGTDTFYPVQSAFDPTTGRAIIADRAAYVRDGVLVARIPPRSSFELGGTSITLDLRVTDATISGRIAGDRLEDVVLAARMGVDDIITQLDALGVCEGDTLRAPAIAVLRGAADVLANPEATPGALIPCDAISIAIGFTGFPGSWGKPPRRAEVRPNVCDVTPDAGAPDGGAPMDAGLDGGM